MAAAAPPRPAQAPPSNANKKFLKQYARANGNMSVQKRLQVIVPALERLGYSQKDAVDIAIDAPLSKDYTNEQAMRAALEYASSITPNSPNGGVNQILANNPIAMPPAAAQQLSQLQTNSKPFGPLRKGASNTGGRLQKGFSRLRSRLSPYARRIGDQSTPGGIGSLFALNLLFLAAVVPANSQGFTRVELMWLTLMNRTKFSNELEPPPVPDNALIEAAVGVAEGIQATAQQIGNVAGSIASIPNDVGNFFDNIPVFGGVIHALTGSGPNDMIPPATTTGNTPPMTRSRPPGLPGQRGPTQRQGI